MKNLDNVSGVPLPPELDEKYALMWHESCGWEIPFSITPFSVNGRLSAREVRLYSEACWKILNMMADDGLIRQSTLRRLHEEENGWEPGRSTIKTGYTLPETLSNKYATGGDNLPMSDLTNKEN